MDPYIMLYKFYIIHISLLQGIIPFAFTPAITDLPPLIQSYFVF